MTIDRAIKNLKAGRKDCGMIPEEEYTATIDLAIAALGQFVILRKALPLFKDNLLPGETEEKED